MFFPQNDVVYQISAGTIWKNPTNLKGLIFSSFYGQSQSFTDAYLLTILRYISSLSVPEQWQLFISACCMFTMSHIQF